MKSRTSKTPATVRLLEDRGNQRRVLLVGAGAREHAIGEALCASGRAELYVFAHNDNPGLKRLAKVYRLGKETNAKAIRDFAIENAVDLAVMGLEDPLAVGAPDVLIAAGIPTIGPVKAAAQLETSKLFLRDLMREHQLRGSVEYEYVTDVARLEHVLRTSGREFALKPVGLTAGKGVQVMGVQLESADKAVEYGKSVIQHQVGGTAGILLEERLEGPEFTLQAFVDKYSVKTLPLVKDYKLAYDGDTGPNTGSMGSYSRADGSLAFVEDGERREAAEILESVVRSVRSAGIVYRGIIYGQFMKTRAGLKLIEINARFGDPEAINVLSVLETDFLEVCEAIVTDRLSALPLRFKQAATVCKYITPPEYPTNPRIGSPIALEEKAIRDLGVLIFFAKVDGEDGRYFTTSSRSIALVGIGPTVEDAHVRVEDAFRHVMGEHHSRHDIGTRKLTEEAVRDWTQVSKPTLRIVGH
jgi:phosphoribosylamine---glycine ligase